MTALKAIVLSAILVATANTSISEPMRIGSDEVLRGHFVQERHFKDFSKPMPSVGSFVLAPGQGLIWRSEKPFSFITVITAKGMVQIVEGRETSRMVTTKVEFLARLNDILGRTLGGDWAALESSFLVTRELNSSDMNLTLIPKKIGDITPEQIKRISVRANRFVEEVEIVRADGDRDHLTFSGQTLSAAPLEADEIALFAEVNR